MHKASNQRCSHKRITSTTFSLSLGVSPFSIHVSSFFGDPIHPPTNPPKLSHPENERGPPGPRAGLYSRRTALRLTAISDAMTAEGEALEQNDRPSAQRYAEDHGPRRKA